MPRQSAFIFIKPHAVNDVVIDYVRKRLKNENYNILHQGNLPCTDIRDGNLATKHYGTLAQRALSIKPLDLPRLSEKAEKSFYNEFQTTFDDAIDSNTLMNVTEYYNSLNIEDNDKDPFMLEKEWRSSTCVKLFPGTYCAKMTNGSIVINGFFPAMRAKYTNEDMAPNGIHWFVVEWEEGNSGATWETFRTTFIGATNPSKAIKESIRGQLFTNWEEMKLSKPPEGSDNGVHASASPVEAAYEIGEVWLTHIVSTLEETSMYQEAVHSKGMKDTFVRSWLTNSKPNDDSFDICEHKDMSACFNIMLERYNQKHDSSTSSSGHSTPRYSTWNITVPMIIVLCLLLSLFYIVCINNSSTNIIFTSFDIASTGSILQYSTYTLYATVLAHLLEYVYIFIILQEFQGSVNHFIFTMVWGYLYWSQLRASSKKKDKKEK
jgi:nucleoside diphosphate kinase